MLYPFVCSIKYDDEKVEFIKSFDVFQIEPKKNKPEPPNKPRWNMWNVLPNFEEWGFTVGMEYALRSLCDLASDGDALAYDMYWNEKTLADVWDRLAFLKRRLF